MLAGGRYVVMSKIALKSSLRSIDGRRAISGRREKEREGEREREVEE